MRKNQIICRVTWLSPLPGGRSTTPNYSLKARMLRIKQTNGLDFSTALPTSPRRLPILPQPVFHEVLRAARPWTTDDKRRLSAPLNFRIFAARDDFSQLIPYLRLWGG